jgi:hypothetical protein
VHGASIGIDFRGADDVWRARVGDYRILYQVRDDRRTKAALPDGSSAAVSDYDVSDISADDRGQEPEVRPV